MLIGMLPPFHSFGITVTTILPLCSGLRTVYHPNPTEAAVLARLIEAYGVTVLVGTPTFLNGIVRAARGEQLASLRLAVTGAEKCPDAVYQALARPLPASASILEGYGITECSPIVSANRPGAPGAGQHRHAAAVGRRRRSSASRRRAACRSAQRACCSCAARASSTATSTTRASRPSSSSRGGAGTAPATSSARTRAAWLFFEGRLKRFVKLGGEMISLPAIEAVLRRTSPRDADEGPPSSPSNRSARPKARRSSSSACRPAERDQVNEWLRDAGLSPLHYVRRGHPRRRDPGARHRQDRLPGAQGEAYLRPELDGERRTENVERRTLERRNSS